MSTKSFLLIVVFNFLSFQASASFDFTPIIASVAPGGSGATASFTVANLDDTKTPVQISIYKREPDVDGKETYLPSQDASDQFQIYPSQLILKPKEKRTVRVTFVGDPKIKEEMAFRIISEEFPINVSDDTKVKKKAVMSLNIMTKYVGSLYVTPIGTRPEIKITASKVQDKSGTTKMLLSVANLGTEHFMLKRPKIKVSAKKANKEIELPFEALSSIGVQNILANKTRNFTIPWPADVPHDDILSFNVETDKQ